MAETPKSSDIPKRTGSWWSKNWFYTVLIAVAVIGGLSAFGLPLIVSQPFSAGDSISTLRQAILAATGGVLAILTLWENRRKNIQEKEKNDQDHTRQVHAERRSRYAKAIEQLADEKAPIRLGGIYTLVKLVDEWLADEKTLPNEEERREEGQVIVNSLCAYIRSPFDLVPKAEVLSQDQTPENYEGGDQQFVKDRARFREEKELRLTILEAVRNRLNKGTRIHKNGTQKLLPGQWSGFDYDFSNTVFFYPVGFNNSYFDASSNFSGVEFTEASFFAAKFTEKANFYRAEFTQKANFVEAEFAKDADFYRAEFAEKANFYEAEFAEKANFYEAEFTQKANFSWAKLTDADFSGAKLTDADFSWAKLTDADFSGAEFTQSADFYRAKFTRFADFSGAEFPQNANFYRAEFTQSANFHEAEFTQKANFSWAKLTVADFSKAKFFWSADFSWAKLTDADFSGAEFTMDAYFYRAEFTKDADFSGAEFINASFSAATFEDKPKFEYTLDNKTYKTRFSCKTDPEDYNFEVSHNSPYKIETEEQKHNGIKFIIPKGTELFDPDKSYDLEDNEDI